MRIVGLTITGILLAGCAVEAPGVDLAAAAQRASAAAYESPAATPTPQIIYLSAPTPSAASTPAPSSTLKLAPPPPADCDKAANDAYQKYQNMKLPESKTGNPTYDDNVNVSRDRLNLATEISAVNARQSAYNLCLQNNDLNAGAWQKGFPVTMEKDEINPSSGKMEQHRYTWNGIAWIWTDTWIGYRWAPAGSASPNP